MILENDVLKVTVSSFGAEIRSMYDKVNGRELMWSGDASWWARVSPVLFPVVGALHNKEYRHDGIAYSMPNHGFLRDTEMELLRHSDTEVWYRFESNDQSKVMYPFNFEVRIGYVLSDNVVNVKWEVENKGDSAMYFSIGAHPAFLADVGDVFEVESIGETSRYPITADGIGDPYPELVDTINIEPSIFKNDALIYDNTQAVTLITKQANIKVTYDNFMYVGLWSVVKEGGMAPFVCIEPWVGIADFADFKGELRNKTGMVKLGENSVNAYKYSVEVSPK